MEGFVVHVYEPALERMPEEHFQTLIAHELAHVVCYAGEDESHMVPLDADPAESEKAEANAEGVVRGLTLRWGFDHDGLVTWVARHAAELG
jgi:hypothetical protein